GIVSFIRSTGSSQTQSAPWLVLGRGALSYLFSSAGRGGGEGDGLGGADRPPRRPSSAGCLRGRECTVTLAGQHPAATEAGSRDGGAFGRRLPPRASSGWRAVTRSLLSGIDAHNPPPEAASRGGQAASHVTA